MLNIIHSLFTFSPRFEWGIKPVLFFLLNISFLNIVAQENLVPNPSFEEYWECPTGNDLNNEQLEKCRNWWKPTFGTSDYFNRCHTGGVVGVPTNFWGFQEPYQGDAYLGLVPVGWYKNNDEIIGYEYVQTRLHKQLSPCTKYLFTIYVSMANFSQYGIGSIGASFTKDSLYQYNSDLMELIPSVVWESSPIIDTLGWVKMEGVFEAEGNEQFITIGYFNNSLKDDTLFFQDFATEDYASYYYIDNVSLVQLEKDNECIPHLENIFSPNSDDVNDVYSLDKMKGIGPFTFVIINRWGDVVFNYIEGVQEFWNGRNNLGIECPDGVYFYRIETDYFEKTGFIHLVR